MYDAFVLKVFDRLSWYLWCLLIPIDSYGMPVPLLFLCPWCASVFLHGTSTVLIDRNDVTTFQSVTLIGLLISIGNFDVPVHFHVCPSSYYVSVRLNRWLWCVRPRTNL